jgi:hypothetical protein
VVNPDKAVNQDKVEEEEVRQYMDEVLLEELKMDVQNDQEENQK